MPRPSRHLDRALLAAGRELLPVYGCARLTVRQVAEAAGVNIGMFHGGHNTNVVPSACTVEIDRRLLPDEKVKDAFKK